MKKVLHEFRSCSPVVSRLMLVIWKRNCLCCKKRMHVCNRLCEVRIKGLETLDYLDNLSDRKCFTEQGDAIIFESEVDRAYLSTENCIAVIDHEEKFVIKKKGYHMLQLFEEAVAGHLNP
ncbi:putative glucose-6-phosphate 1-epimerase [Apium graveolens]|uniref:putative glucose-6-phosphate 1-epimerase n=1 Tax=Apium graveolens TaxID=4045 RepID=UPI003D7A5F1C